MPRDWTDEEIAAHVDGALDARDEARVRRALETDPEARATAERVRALNGLLAAAHPLPGPDIPDSIAAVLTHGAERVVRFRARPRRQWPELAAAATVALAIGAGAGMMLAGGHGVPESGLTLADAGPALANVLETVSSGTLSEAGIRPISTFRDAAGRPCREFETAGGRARSGIACRLPGGTWGTRRDGHAVGQRAWTGHGIRADIRCRRDRHGRHA